MQMQLLMHSCVAVQVQILPALRSPIRTGKAPVKSNTRAHGVGCNMPPDQAKVPGGCLIVFFKVSVDAEIVGWCTLAEGDCRRSGSKSVIKLGILALRDGSVIGGTEPRISYVFLYFEALVLVVRGELPQR